MFSALQADSITLRLLHDDNLPEVYALLQGHPDSPVLLAELFRTAGMS